MAERLKLIALVNVAAAIAFLLPAVFWSIAEHRPTNSLRVTMQAHGQQAGAGASRPALPSETAALEQRTPELEILAMDRLSQLVGMLVIACGVAFLVNAALLWWCAKRPD